MGNWQLAFVAMASSNPMNCLSFLVIKYTAYFAKFGKDIKVLVDESLANVLKSLKKLARKKEKYPIGRPRKHVMLPPPKDVMCMLTIDLHGDDLPKRLEPLHVGDGSALEHFMKILRTLKIP